MATGSSGSKSVGGPPAESGVELEVLSPWATQMAEAFVRLASDIALVIGTDGIVQRVAQASVDPLAPSASHWVGRPWIETVTNETRPKIQLLLNEASTTGSGRRREVNHPSVAGDAIPVAYSALRLGPNGPVLAVGRDLRSVAAIQQRFLEAQRETEQAYWRARQGEVRYQELFRVANDAVLLLDAEKLQIVEANDSAARLFDHPMEELIGRPAVFCFDKQSQSALEDLLQATRASGQQSEMRMRLANRTITASVSATPFRLGDSMSLLVRVRAVDKSETATDLHLTMARLVDEASDSTIVTDSNGRILLANRAFLDLVQVEAEDRLRGYSLRDWVSVAGRTFDQVVAEVRSKAVIRDLAAQLVLDGTPPTSLRISATLLTDSDQERLGFILKRAPQALNPDSLPKSIDGLFERLSTEPLSTLLVQGTRILEGLLVERALQRSGGDATRAAQLLKISVSELLRLQGASNKPESPPGFGP